MKDGTVGIPFDYNGVVSLLYNRRYVAMVSRSSGYEATDHRLLGNCLIIDKLGVGLSEVQLNY